MAMREVKIIEIFHRRECQSGAAVGQGGPLERLSPSRLELLMEAAVAEKLGPSSGPREKYFARFETYFNGLTEEEREAIRERLWQLIQPDYGIEGDINVETV